MVINPIYGNKKPLSPSRLVPSPPPANIIHNYTNNPPSTPRNNIPNKSSNIPIIQPTNNNRNPNLQIPGSPSLNMHTSDVKIVYQRGSFSPNSPNSSEDNHSVSRSRKHIDVNTDKNNVNKEYLNQYQIQAPKNKISISDLKEKKNEGTIINNIQQPI